MNHYNNERKAKRINHLTPIQKLLRSESKILLEKNFKVNLTKSKN